MQSSQLWHLSNYAAISAACANRAGPSARAESPLGLTFMCRAALETGLAQKRKPAGEVQGRSSKKQSSMMSAVLGDLSGESSDEDS